jgi:hypothetical protein
MKEFNPEMKTEKWISQKRKTDERIIKYPLKKEMFKILGAYSY